MSESLWAAVDALTKPRHVKLLRDHGASDWTTVPSLWWQLEDAAAGVGDAGGEGGSPSRYRSPGSIDCLDLYYDVRETVVDALVSYGRKPEMLTQPFQILVPESLRSLASVLIAQQDDLEWWAWRVSSWGHRITVTLRLLNQPQPRRIRDTACPTCQATHVTLDQGSGPERVPALLIDFHGSLVRAASCSACGSNWFRGDELLELADLLDATRASMTRLGA